MPLCPCLLPKLFSPSAPIQGLPQLWGGGARSFVSSEHLFITKTKKPTHGKSQRWSRAHCTHTGLFPKAAQDGSGVPGCAQNSSRPLLASLCSLSSECGVAGKKEPQAVPRLVFGHLCLGPSPLSPEGYHQVISKSLERQGLRAGAPAFWRPMRLPPNRKKLQEQKGHYRAQSLRPAHNRQWKSSSLSRE